ncbi:hypothetical protein B4O97_15890 [Marispirochaeta aestuarii]|uniref:Sulfatase-modifying factor enzyme-like domain-containing protein n=1 Tax=Marispirochaeta aestuarii TaxID=1963862 RepID=A0A1Y1RUG3_9SPIO|nr:formylglycine-generating enzyme family protein [Marispirochaeta aestuarii]ORC32639.1 hypothetical protein B4O97_15890 [Marispirochaeta aestuarii]
MSFLKKNNSISITVYPHTEIFIRNKVKRVKNGKISILLKNGVYLCRYKCPGKPSFTRLLFLNNLKDEISFDYRLLQDMSEHHYNVKVHNPERLPFEPETLKIPGAHVHLGVQLGEGPSTSLGSYSIKLRSFAISKYEVTNKQFSTFVQSTGYVTDAEQSGGGFSTDGRGHWQWLPSAQWRHPFLKNRISLPDDHPVVMVSWDDAMAYCKWLSNMTNRNYRLPKEAEWEYAARGEDHRLFPWTRSFNGDFHNYCNHGKSHKKSLGRGSIHDGYLLTSPVNAFPRGVSPFGVWDMLGNVKEWMEDDFIYYDEKKNSQHANQKEEQYGSITIHGIPKTLRGTGFYGDPQGYFLNAIARNSHVHKARFSALGFRLVEEL